MLKKIYITPYIMSHISEIAFHNSSNSFWYVFHINSVRICRSTYEKDSLQFRSLLEGRMFVSYSSSTHKPSNKKLSILQLLRARLRQIFQRLNMELKSFSYESGRWGSTPPPKIPTYRVLHQNPDTPIFPKLDPESGSCLSQFGSKFSR